MSNRTNQRIDACKSIAKNKNKYFGSEFNVKIIDMSGNEVANFNLSAESFYNHMADKIPNAIKEDLLIRKHLVESELKQINNFLSPETPIV